MADDGNTKVGGLQIEITANSTKAASAITKLTDALEKLSNVKFESSQLEKIADKLSALGNVKISKNLSTRLTELGKSMESVSDDAIARLDRATTALSKLAGVNLTGVGSAIRAVSRQTSTVSAIDTAGTDVSAMTHQDRSEFGEEIRHDTDELGQAAQRASVNTDKLTQSIQNAELQSMRTNRAYEEMERRLEVLQSIKGFTNSDQYAEAAARVREYSKALEQVENATEAFRSGQAQGLFGSEEEVTAAVEELKELRRQAALAGESAKYALKDAETGAKDYAKSVGIASTALKKLASAAAGWAGGKELSGLKSLGKAFGEQFTKPVTRAIGVINRWKSSIGRIAFYRLIRSAIKAVTDGFKTGIEDLYQYSRLTNTEFAPAMDRLATSSLYLKNSLGAMAAPLIQAIAPAVDFLVDKFVSLLNVIGKVMAALTGKSVYSQAKKYATEYADAADKAAGATKEFQKYLIGIDELNIINDPKGGGGAGAALDDYASMFEEVEVPNEYADWAKKIREAIENGDWYGAGAALADKLNELIANADFDGWGSSLGEKIQHGIELGLGFMRTANWQGLGAGLADFLNGLINGVDPNDLGALIASKIQAGIEFAYGFVTRFRWGEFGEWLGGIVNGWFAEIDWAMLGKTISKGIKGLLQSAEKFLAKVDWGQVGENIADMLTNIDWSGVWDGFWDAADAAVRAVIDLFTGLDDNLSGSAEILWDIAKALAAWKISNNVLGWFDKLSAGKFSKQLESVKSSIGKIATGLAISITGLTIESSGIRDMVMNGPDLQNVIKTALGSALGVVGTALAFGFTPTGWAVGLGVALTVGIATAIKAASDKEQLEYENSDYYKHLQEIIKKAQESIEVSKEVQIRIEARAENYEQAGRDIEAILPMLEKILDLSDIEVKTADQLSELQNYVDIVNGLNIPDLHLDLDPDGHIKQTRDDIETITQNLIQQAKLTAAGDLLVQAYKELYDFEQNTDFDVLKDALEDAKDTTAAQREEFEKLDKAYQDFVSSLQKGYGNANGVSRNAIFPQQEEWKAAKRALEDAEEAQRKAQEAVDEATKSYEGIKNEISKYESVLGDLNTQVSKNAEDIAPLAETYNSLFSDLAENWARDGQLGGDMFREATNAALSAGIPQDTVDLIVGTFDILGTAWNHDGNIAGENLKEAVQASLAGGIPRDIVKGITDAFGGVPDAWYSEFFNGAEEAKQAIRAVQPDIVKAAEELVRETNNKLKFSADLSVNLKETPSSQLYFAQAPAYASGGFPTEGELFMARESGPELVGTIGGRTAVANNDQIVQGISAGVEGANVGVINALYAVAQQIIRTINDKDMNAYMDGEVVTKRVSTVQSQDSKMYWR